MIYDNPKRGTAAERFRFYMVREREFQRRAPGHAGLRAALRYIIREADDLAFDFLGATRRVRRSEVS